MAPSARTAECTVVREHAVHGTERPTVTYASSGPCAASRSPTNDAARERACSRDPYEHSDGARAPERGETRASRKSAHLVRTAAASAYASEESAGLARKSRRT